MSCEAPLKTLAKKQNALSKLEECMRDLEGASLAEREQDDGATEDGAEQELLTVSVADLQPLKTEPQAIRGKPEQATRMELKAKASNETKAGSKGLHPKQLQSPHTAAAAVRVLQLFAHLVLNLLFLHTKLS